MGQSTNIEATIDDILGGIFTGFQSEWVGDIAEMHTKFGVNDVIRSLPPEKLATFLQFRLNFLQEELDEAKAAAARLNSLIDAQQPLEVARAQAIDAADDIVDAMVDLCVVAIGTMNAFDVDADEAWDRVFEKNMLKDAGVNPNRPNPLGLPDMIKPAGWTAPTHADNTGFITRIAGVEDGAE